MDQVQDQADRKNYSLTSKLKKRSVHIHVKQFESEFSALVDELLEKDLTVDDLIARLEVFLGTEPELLFGADKRVRKLIEYCFYSAEGPYNPDFSRLKPAIKKILLVHPPVRKLLASSGDHAIANMVLGKRGRLKISILDRYELRKTLYFWAEVGLGTISERDVFEAVINKKSVKNILENEQDSSYLTLVTRLKLVFPYYIKSIISNQYDIEEEIFNLTKRRFAFVDTLLAKGAKIEDLIEKENKNFEPTRKRNYYLAFLVKKKHQFACQFCKQMGKTNHFRIETHHVVPLYKGGDDQSENMIVLCKKHHRLADKGKIKIELHNTNVFIYDRGKKYVLKTN